MPRALWLAVLASACVARPSAGDLSSDDSTTDASTATDLPGTGDTSSTSGDMPTPLEPDTPCGPPCDAPWELQGDLILDFAYYEGEDLSPFECLIAVHGDLTIRNDPFLPAEQLTHLRHLQKVDGALLLDSLWEATDLSAFACLREVDKLHLYDMRGLVDASLPNLRWAPHVEVSFFTVMPSFAPDFAGLSTLRLAFGDIADLSAAASWRSLGELDLELYALTVTDLRGLEGLVAGSPRSVGLGELGLLTSLRGLETITDPGWIGTFDLPKLSDISALSGVTRAGGIGLFWLPSLSTHVGLHNLESVGELLLGDCSTDAPQSPAKDLTGFDALVAVDRLELHIAHLTALAGAPNLRSLREFSVHQNPGLDPAEIKKFLAQLDAPPELVDILAYCDNSHG